MMNLVEGDFEAFFNCPFNIYSKDDLYVSPFKADLARFLDKQKNPLFKHFGEFTFFTVSEDKKTLGRIVAHVHHASNERFGTKTSYFGYFDCVDDDSVAQCLLRAAELWGKSKGCNEISGNFNLTAMQSMGVMTGGFENQPYLDHAYNPPHIVKLLKNAGYEPYFPVTTFELSLAADVPKRILNKNAETLMNDQALTLKTVTRGEFQGLMQHACKVLNAGFENNPLFVPLTMEEFWFQAKEMMWVMDPRISLVAYFNDKPVGVVVCIPDLNPLLKASRSRLSVTMLWHYLRYRLNRKRAVIIYYSVVPDFHGRGLNSMMLSEVTRRLIKYKYTSLGITWIADVNQASLRQMEKIGGRPLHRLSLFKKSLTA